MSAPRITWTEEPHSTRGRSGRIEVASVGWGTVRQDAMWYLHTPLPVRSSLPGQKYMTKEDAKLAAEKMLVAFISEIGGSL